MPFKKYSTIYCSMPDCIVCVRLCLCRCHDDFSIAFIACCMGLIPDTVSILHNKTIWCLVRFRSFPSLEILLLVNWNLQSLSPRFIVSTYFFLFSFSFCHLRWFRRRCRMILYRMFVIVFIVVSQCSLSLVYHSSNNEKRTSGTKSGKFFTMVNTLVYGNGGHFPSRHQNGILLC